MLAAKRAQIHSKMDAVRARNEVAKKKIENWEPDDEVHSIYPDKSVIYERFVKGVQNQPKMKLFTAKQLTGDDLPAQMNEFLLGLRDEDL